MRSRRVSGGGYTSLPFTEYSTHAEENHLNGSYLYARGFSLRSEVFGIVDRTQIEYFKDDPFTCYSTPDH